MRVSLSSAERDVQLVSPGASSRVGQKCPSPKGAGNLNLKIGCAIWCLIETLPKGAAKRCVQYSKQYKLQTVCTRPHVSFDKNVGNGSGVKIKLQLAIDGISFVCQLDAL